MKNIFLALFLFCIYSVSNAQITQGNILAGGAVSFTSQKYSGAGGSTNVLHIMPDAGYFFADKIAGGIRASFTDYSDAVDSYRDLLIGPFARYYFLPVAQKTNIFLEGSFAAGIQKYDGFDAESKSQFGFSAGPAFFLNPHVAVEATLNWSSLKYKDDNGRFNTFGLAIGFQVHLHCKKQKK